MVSGYFYTITVLLLKTLRLPEIRTCETTDELRWVINSRHKQGDKKKLPYSGPLFLYVRKSTSVIIRHRKNLVARASSICEPLNDASNSSNIGVRE
jgi:hypothetical protein